MKYTFIDNCITDFVMSATETELSNSVLIQQREQRNGETYKGSLLQAQGSVSRQNSGEEDLKVRRQMHKQESKDSGIVTEMSTRPKDYGRSKTEKIHRTESSKAKSRKSESFKSSVKRSQSMKAPHSDRHLSQSSNKSTGNLKDLDNDNQIEVLSPKQNGSVENLDQDSKKSSATIKSMWKKAFKNLKSTSDTKLTKKGSLIKKKQNSQEAEVEETVEAGEIDPVYSLLKCAADLPKVGKQGSCGIHAQCSGHHSNKGDSSSSTSKTTSPASSGNCDVTDSLGSDFKTYYKQTSPAIKKQNSSPFIIPF